MRLAPPLIAVASALVLVGCGGGTPTASGDHTAVPAESLSSPSPSVPAEVRPGDFADEAADIVAGFSDEELAGSLIIGTWDRPDAQAGAELIRKSHLGGVIVMADALPADPTAKQVKAVTTALASARTDGRPVSIGVDQEGGPVSRLSTAALPFPPLMALGATDDLALTTSATRVQARDLADLGFTIDFAPDSDVTTGPADVTINVRSAGGDYGRAAEVVASAVTGYWEGGIASSAKHFPGHGRLAVDSHKGLPVSAKSVTELESTDIKPFKAAVKAGVPMVMMGHIGLPGATMTPATLNPKAYTALRRVLDYDGVIITDALNMQAVPQGLHGGETVRALKAGADLALMPPDASAAQKAVVAALGSGELTKKQLVEKSERVVAMQLATAEKQKEVADASGSATDSGASDDAEAVLTDVAEKSLTVLTGECRFAGTDAISIIGGGPRETAALRKAAEEEGLTVGSSGTRVSFSPGAAADVVISTSAPWRMRNSPAKAAIGVYDDNEFAMDAAAKWLKGDLTATATLPVKYDGSTKAPSCG